MAAPQDENDENDDPRFAKLLEEIAHAPRVPLEKPESWVGRTLGRHLLGDVVASGGMGTVYRARAEGPDGFARNVAVKVIHPHLGRRPGFAKMFVREARLLSHVHHPNVVHIEELGEEGGDYYLVMELVVGHSLTRVLRGLLDHRRRVADTLATYLAMQIADGLHATHEATDAEGRSLGIVHRDVSPHNVMISTGGHVKLIDFGVAKAKGFALESTTGSLRGKLRYMAPEQAARGLVDRRTDVYALGIVLWEMLTMRSLFRATSDFALMQAVRNPQIEPPSQHANVPAALESVVMACLATDPGARPSTALEVRRMLATAVPEAIAIDAPMVAAVVRAVVGEAGADTGDPIDHTLAHVGGDPSLVLDTDRTVPTPPEEMAVGDGGAALAPPAAMGRRGSALRYVGLALVSAVTIAVLYWLWP